MCVFYIIGTSKAPKNMGILNHWSLDDSDSTVCDLFSHAFYSLMARNQSHAKINRIPSFHTVMSNFVNNVSQHSLFRQDT